MNDLAEISAEMSLLTPGRLYLLWMSSSLRRPLLNELTARLALRGEVQVLVGGNRFDAHGIARLLRRKTEAVIPCLRRIHVARAFTCYQVHALIMQAYTHLPTLVTDLLDTFYDESVPLGERRTLLAECVQRLHWLSRGTETLIGAAPRHATPLPTDSALAALQEEWLELLRSRADVVWTLELPADEPNQLVLF
jgi:hypothetical protein